MSPRRLLVQPKSRASATVTIEELLVAHRISLASTAPGRHYTTCPQCSAKRSKTHQRSKCLGVTIDTNGVRWGCNHCGWTGPAKGNAGEAWRHEGDWVYLDAEEKPYLRVVRYRKPDGGKSYPQYHLEDGQHWVKGKPAGPKIPYRLPELLDADRTEPVFIVEGEKCADRVAEEGVAVTTASEGAGNWTADLNQYFADRIAWIIPDSDEKGRKHARQVALNLHAIAREVRIVQLPVSADRGSAYISAEDRTVEIPTIADGEDVYEFLANGGNSDDLRLLGEHAPIWQPQNGEGTSQWPEGLRENPKQNAPTSLESLAASTYAMRGIRWFWNNRFALGKLGLIGGLPDRGKGLIASYMIAMATTAGVWPCNEGRAIQGNVLLLTAEDNIEDTIVPRLVAAGADCERVHIVKMVHQADAKRMFSLVTDLPMLRQKIDEIGDVVLIVIDPMSAYLGVGKIDSYRSTDVRGVLAPLKELAEETMIAIISIMHFNKKADVHNAMLRIADSLAYVAAARHCYVVVDDVENQRRLFVKAKNNVAPDMAALSYTIDTMAVGQDPDTKATIAAPFVVWGSEHVAITATEAMLGEGTAAGSSRHGARITAKTFLADILAHGPVPKSEIEEAADANCISARTLARAKSELGVLANKRGLKGGWTWELPQQKAPPAD
jgi:putative DNA primase/helicase